MATQTREKKTRRSEKITMTTSSEFSPTIISRKEEKQQLVNLNDRLANYIDRVRSLELENNRLTVQITNIEESTREERNNVKEIYEKELADARRLLDETAGDKARLQIEAGKYKNEVDDLRPRVKKLEKDLDTANNRIRHLESLLTESDGRNRALSQENKQLQDQISDLKKQLDNKDKQLKISKKQVEEETVARVDLENRIQSLKEELAFKEQLYKEELSEVRSHRQTDVGEYAAPEELNFSLLDSLRELREQHEAQTSIFRTETEEVFTSKLADLKAIAERYRTQYTQCQDELRTIKTSMDSRDSEIATLRAQNEALVSRIRDLEGQIKLEAELHREALRNRELELQQMRDAMAEQLQLYQELMDIKLTLDAEITTYRKLLEGEEFRLKMDATPSPVRSSSSSSTLKKGGAKRSQQRVQQSKKRRRVEDTRSTVQSATAAGVVAIEDSDPEGAYIKLHNTSEADQPLGGWILQRQADDGDILQYKFTSKYVLKGGEEVTVWSAGSGGENNPPTDLLNKKVDNWGVGETISTTLLDASGEVMATRNLTRETVEYEYESGVDDEVGKEELFYQQGDPEKRCSIM